MIKYRKGLMKKVEMEEGYHECIKGRKPEKIIWRSCYF